MMISKKELNLDQRIVFWTSVGHFCNHIGNYLTPALLIYLQTDIQLSQTERGILGSIPMIILVFLSTLIGYIGDKKPLWGKYLIWGGILGIGGFGIFMSIANSFMELIIATIILGFSLSTFHPLAFNFINLMPNKDKNMGILSVSGNFGSAITPIVAMVFVIITSSWRVAFILFSIFQIVIGISFAIQFPNDEYSEKKLNNNEKFVTQEMSFSDTQMMVLLGLLVLVSISRAPVFRCISYFTTIIFSDAFEFSNIESSILSGFVLGVGASATFIIGILNNRKTNRGASRNERVDFRSKTMLLSSGLSSVFLILLVLIPTSESISIFLVYICLTFFYFLGAAIIPTIISEVVNNKGMSSAFGIMFSGATLAGACAPTIFGFLADNYGFWASFIFLGVVAFICFSLIVLFLVTFRSYMIKMESTSSI
ncbi:MAG: MFS transporter [Candidatus Hodarchaeota archaeon]